MAKRIITEADVVAAASGGATSLCAPPDECIVTEQARDRAALLGLSLTGETPDGQCPDQGACPVQGTSRPGSRPDAYAPGPDEAVVRQVVAALGASLPPGADPALVERLVRQAVAGQVAAAGGASAESGGVRLVERAALLGQGASSLPAQEKTVLAEALPREADTGLAAGYLAWERSSFKREVEAPEVGVVIEGELHLTVGGQTLIGRPGDMVYLPRGAKALFSAPGRVVLACVNGRS